MQLKVGSYYRSREGKITAPLVRNDPRSAMPFRDPIKNHSYRSDGAWIGQSHPYDLIEEVDSKGQPLVHETLKQENKWWNWVVTKHPDTIPPEAQTFSLPDGAIAYRVKKPPIITTTQVLVSSKGSHKYYTVDVIDGVVQDLLIKGSDW